MEVGEDAGTVEAGTPVGASGPWAGGFTGACGVHETHSARKMKKMINF
jgi:hypothetical protein